MTTNQQGAVPKALRPVEPGALAASIQELEDWESRADDERLTPSEGESVILVLHELKRLRALSAASLPVVPAVAMESVLIDGVAHQTPTPVAADLLRLHMELLQARQLGAVCAARPVRDLTDADMDRLITLLAQHDHDEIGHQGLVEAVVREFTVLRSLPPAPAPAPTFQVRVKPWLLQCFGAEIAADTMERNHRYFEESTELVQANGMTRSEAHQLVDYTYDRPVGELNQEIGGAMVTLAALCLSRGIDMHSAGETELARIWTKVEAIRAKQAAKPKHSPLPEAPQDHGACAPGCGAEIEVVREAMLAWRCEAVQQYGLLRKQISPGDAAPSGEDALDNYAKGRHPAILGYAQLLERRHG